MINSQLTQLIELTSYKDLIWRDRLPCPFIPSQSQLLPSERSTALEVNRKRSNSNLHTEGYNKNN
ncbi:Uncharacterized protein APZ42_017181 [Daphnia magna]|uniref:Uncharacterized protein n=1 Tax=Daphnia magna TaxID=35525 RepID=A0A164ZPK6_9CRUS|nr:Uncharacterized protein APZ42_017181 [Daphnia magna]